MGFYNVNKTRFLAPIQVSKSVIAHFDIKYRPNRADIRTPQRSEHFWFWPRRGREYGVYISLFAKVDLQFFRRPQRAGRHPSPVSRTGWGGSTSSRRDPVSWGPDSAFGLSTGVKCLF